jgi:hypothetical protein
MGGGSLVLVYVLVELLLLVMAAFTWMSWASSSWRTALTCSQYLLPGRITYVTTLSTVM